MPLYLTGALSSRVTKSGPTPTLRRTASSPLATARRTKSSTRKRSLAGLLDKVVNDEDDDGEDEQLGATGKIVHVHAVASAKDVASAMRYATEFMFSTLPDRAGMNSTRISEVLNFHKSLPPIVTLAHVHALISASSRTEREIQMLMATGKVRKLKVSGRGNDINGLSEVLIQMSDYEKLLRSSALPSETVSAFLQVLHEHPRISSLFTNQLKPAHTAALTRGGFLVSASFSGPRSLSLAGSSLVSTSTISRGASGTFAAVGGDAAFENLGGVGSMKRSDRTAPPTTKAELALSVPNLGPYLRLLQDGRTHLLDLLRLSKHRQAPMYLLKERWDGAIDNDNRVSSAKRSRGEFSLVLPAKTKKWKDLNGLKFEWTLEECLGAGLIELFETHSVGYGVRALT